ncbi:large ribosomal subunit protein mL48-like [Maylandia zebra]|uniref:large ribosomal subunit protein mL48-like n=1 Tax=Maylandia zebra TaxID=106582 RepID=UPI00403CF067
MPPTSSSSSSSLPPASRLQGTPNFYSDTSLQALRYALPTKSTEVMLMQEQGTKTYVDAVLKTHHRVVQLSTLNAALCPV